MDWPFWHVIHMFAFTLTMKEAKYCGMFMNFKRKIYHLHLLKQIWPIEGPLATKHTTRKIRELLKWVLVTIRTYGSLPRAILAPLVLSVRRKWRKTTSTNLIRPWLRHDLSTHVSRCWQWPVLVQWIPRFLWVLIPNVRSLSLQTFPFMGMFDWE